MHAKRAGYAGDGLAGVEWLADFHLVNKIQGRCHDTDSGGWLPGVPAWAYTIASDRCAPRWKLNMVKACESLAGRG